jgi:hypothetical protein
LFYIETDNYVSLPKLNILFCLLTFHRCKLLYKTHHHHQPINVPTARAQAFLMDYIRSTGLNPRGSSADLWMLTTAKAAETNSLTCVSKHVGARDSKFLVTHPMTILLNFRDCTPKHTDLGVIELLISL